MKINAHDVYIGMILFILIVIIGCSSIFVFQGIIQ